MAVDVTSLLRDALDLSADERAELVTRLLASLDTPGETLLDDAAWLAEIEARARRAHAGERGAPWPEALERLRKSLHEK